MNDSGRSVLAALLACVIAGSALAQEPPAAGGDSTRTRAARSAETGEQVERRLASVSLLIENSSAARQVESSANPAALKLRENARELFQGAEQAWRAGNPAGATQLLNQAARLMHDAARQAAPSHVTGDKDRSDFNARMESVKALLAAQGRISAEKHLDAREGETSGRIARQIQQAAALAAANQPKEARAVLDEAYADATASLARMRMGDTTTRTLHFANAQEEYRYEVDRGDAHLLLVNTLLKEKRGSNPGLEHLVANHLQAAARLRGDAEAMAAKGDFGSAVKLQENSTQELLRAIRSAGIHIPG